jgi:hypothetical protein
MQIDKNGGGKDNCVRMEAWRRKEPECPNAEVKSGEN